MTYRTLERRIQEVPEEYLNEIADYVEYILYKINHRKTEDSDKEVSAYFGSIKRPMNGLEIQKELRNDWN
ncbi:MAG: DUF2281 domain-containing protein [Anaerolineaceae bacterium]|nr:DUF2281 domain-containing protein [Anaerolineaceae bacterium]